MKERYITVVGSLNYDMLIKQKRLPAAGETYTADSVSFAGGGKGANQAVQSAKLGIMTRMIGKVGDDSFGIYLKSQLRQYGVDTELVGISKESTGVATVHALEDGTVYATIVPGANFDYTKQDIDRVEPVITNGEILVLQLEIPTEIVEYAIEKAAAAGVYIILNAAPAKELSPQVLSLVNCLVVNEVEASFYAGKEITDEASARLHAELLLNMVKETVIITLGEKGSLLCEKEELFFIPAVKAKQVVETTGAGDSYIGAFAGKKLEGRSNREACNFAARVAAVTVGGMGAQPSMPDRSMMNNYE